MVKLFRLSKLLDTRDLFAEDVMRRLQVEEVSL